MENKVISILRRGGDHCGRRVRGRDYRWASMKGRYAIQGSIVRGWNLHSRNMDVLRIIGEEAVRMFNIIDDLHLIWGRGVHIQRKNDVVQRGDSEP
jgi:hypothetical protein